MTVTQAELPLALITIAIGPLVLTISVCLVLHPLADIAVSADALPDAVAVLDAVDPLTIICVSIDPRVEALARDASVLVVAQVLIAIAESLVALPMALVTLPLAFVDAANLIHADALSVPMTIVQLTSIE